MLKKTLNLHKPQSQSPLRIQNLQRVPDLPKELHQEKLLLETWDRCTPLRPCLPAERPDAPPDWLKLPFTSLKSPMIKNRPFFRHLSRTSLWPRKSGKNPKLAVETLQSLKKSSLKSHTFLQPKMRSCFSVNQMKTLCSRPKKLKLKQRSSPPRI